MRNTHTPIPRWRLRYRTWPRPALYLTDTPRPGCPDCHGDGGWEEDYADQDGDYGGTEGVLCACWDPARMRALLRLPHRVLRLLRRLRRPPGGYSDEPPF